MINYQPFFSTDYITARKRFTAAAAEAGADHQRYYLSQPLVDTSSDCDLSIDVASIGQGSELLVLSSGLHGIEGFFGSAVQLALLEQLRDQSLRCRVLLIHAMNPWGFHFRRRVDCNNIDLNRNFPTAQYKGSPNGYHQLNSLLNTESASAPFDWFTPRALLKIAQYGMPALKQAVASGQYDYPQGLFFGGHAPAASTRIVTGNMREWVGQADRVFHADIHTGLGRYAQCKLLIPEYKSSAVAAWCKNQFDPAIVEIQDSGAQTSYPVNGMFGDWLLSEFDSQKYFFVGAEVGTYSAVRVLQALREENRQHFYGAADSLGFANAKRDLQEYFCPADDKWRQNAVGAVLRIVDQAVASLNC